MQAADSTDCSVSRGAQEQRQIVEHCCVSISPETTENAPNPQSADIDSNDNIFHLRGGQHNSISKSSVVRIKSETPQLSPDIQGDMNTEDRVDVSQDREGTSGSRFPTSLDRTPNLPTGVELHSNNPDLGIHTDSMSEEESLFVSGADRVRSEQTMESGPLRHRHTRGSDNSNNCGPADHLDVSEEVEAQSSSREDARETGNVPAEPKKTKIVRKQAGPRSRSAKEWFAKRPKDPREALPQVAGVKRKRSKKDNNRSSRSEKRKRSRKDESNNKGKKGHRKKGSMKVMAEMLQRLRHSNPMEARMALGDISEADPIVATTKINQFQQIMRGLPENVTKANTRGDKKKLMEATRSFGFNNCVAQDGKWLIKGMKTALYNHQVVGVSWMLRREFSEEGPWGGILGDEMGMGKTLQALACIVSNRPTEQDLETYSPSTLIVAPASSLKQWEQEIRKHACNEDIGESAKGIILASYHEISREYPSKKQKARLQSDCRSGEGWKETRVSDPGPVFKIPFWRVILDEAHNIKNRDTNTSVACQSLPGRYRWGMSGTPITNTLDELYPYLKFLKTDWAGSLRDFQYLYANTGDEESANRLTVIMNILMLRRTMKDSFMGRPLYRIPMCYITVRRVHLTKEERIIYNVVETRLRETLNTILSEGRHRCVPLKDMNLLLLYVLRLRQAAAHPFLLEPVLKKTLVEGDLHKIKARLRKVGGQQPAFKQIGKWCGKAVTAVNNNTEQNDLDGQHSFGKSEFGYKFNIDQQINLALASQNEDACRICYQEPAATYKARCKHIFCRECLDNHIQEEYRDGRVVPKCPDCNKSLTDYEPMDLPDTDDADIEGSRIGGTPNPMILAPPKQGLDSFKRHPKLNRKQSEFLRESDQAYPKPVVPSAKTVAVKEVILKWQAEAPGDKIIVFTEFKVTAAILGRMLNAESIRFLYFGGGLHQVANQNAIRGFHEKEDIKVMIASFKCGAVALNLACANRVILIDLWWNVAIEMQAFSRVFRIGQTKETHFLRLIAQNTIDNRIEALQEEKVNNINMALNPNRRENLSIEQIATLFGHLQESDDGSFEVVSDCEGDAGVDETEEVQVIGATE
ncbi:hypothetical protein O1611_g3802 [Lasiodiplodia mahajangana]|uniref:Uncharacterized protein n=1 Tax=Lasiodiplodia mahajangana TaxID=1108764 RepID=A0ACC2JQP4_9PEZI|nr:hypothetical protein O1611_g3802 [Lasiodiplodia mahajangana]